MAMMILPLVISIGGMLLQRLFAPKQKDQYGARLSDINVPQVSPGNPIPRIWGSMKLTSQLIWTSRLIETVHAQQQSSGGKGGPPSPTSYTYTYAVNCALSVCAGPIVEVRRIWANQKILWESADALNQAQVAFDTAYYSELDRLVNQEYMTDIDEAYVSAFFFAQNNYAQQEYTYGTQAEALAYIMAHPGYTPNVSISMAAPNSGDVNALLGQMLSPLGQDMQYAAYKVRFDQIDLYLGYDDQLPNSLMESFLGAGNVPGYRGLAYFVLHNLQLEDFGNAIPTFNAEVVQANGDVVLIDVLADVCEEAGLDPTEYDSLAYMPTTATMKGYAVTQSTTARDIINGLQKVFPFDACESGFQLVFNWINQAPTLIMRREDFGAHIDTDQLPDSEHISRAHDLDMPKRLNLKYQEPARNYSVNTVFASRQITQSQTVEDVEVTIALDRPSAKTWAEEQLALRFTTRRSFKMFLPAKYVIIEPGDVVNVPYKDEVDLFYGLRAIEVNVGVNSIIEATFIDHNFHVPVDSTTALDNSSSDTNPSQTGAPAGSPTHPYMLDLPLLTDAEADNVGYYTVLEGATDGWTGGALLVDMGNTAEATAFGTAVPSSTGSNWYLATQNASATPTGFCLSPLPAASPGTWDYVSVIRVMLLNPNAMLYNVDPWDMLNQPLNVAVIGSEIVQFANARSLGNSIWELTGFLRGLRGTEGSIGTHQPGENFIKMSAAATKRVVHAQDYLQQQGNYKAVTRGDTADSVNAFQFTDTGNSLRPRSPQIKDAHRDDSGNIVVNWFPRNRQNGNWVTTTVVMDQATEAYSIDAYHDPGVKKTFALGPVRTWSYSAVDQTTDFGSATPLTIDLYQIGNIIGRGFVASVNV